MLSIILFLALLSTFGTVLIIVPNSIDYYKDKVKSTNITIMLLYFIIASALWALLFYLTH